MLSAFEKLAAEVRGAGSYGQTSAFAVHNVSIASPTMKKLVYEILSVLEPILQAYYRNLSDVNARREEMVRGGMLVTTIMIHNSDSNVGDIVMLVTEFRSW